MILSFLEIVKIKKFKWNNKSKCLNVEPDVGDS
jgi:hypothetical protein